MNTISQETLHVHMFSFWVVDIDGEQVSDRMSVENAMKLCESKRGSGDYFEVVGKLEF